ncbi:hypothetical protein [Bradyrhizobium canariense]|uniref:Uncharacterized protein n=1 Tax=Bradyrhizobium canariense TaxID=255045 RepID=A0A1H1SE16_9BRAD|nr:hypothetical protein [Bradyrhizobium canariense]SDS46171.1 hypothetical protein SAMN05444158_2128 [Bradyrhizobium canariense]
MDALIVLSTGEALAGALGGVAVGGMLQDSSFGKAVNAIVGLVGGVTIGYLLHTTFPEIASSVSNGSLGAILGEIIGALVGGGIAITICALVKDNVRGVRGDRLR